MIARKCDSCKNLLVEDNCIQLSKRTIRTDHDNTQKAEVIVGEYCKTCLENGNAVKDLLGTK